ncbi:hypothetical protein BDK51DRAFT_44140 [Blyttiomyces helicus]|uniref:Uncharacterized protein n=1 Tax=Blyttiomyces helicus TaxID=388810 RepID=A0A4P9WPQ5_9FUNG|nr:hypothetical protein BDK51DRAFT_44140 [Blyttiomyces helicus]|eukprot:RKO92796.1 hypothetical protein BDK51DRAFT_44140 [Blyttiomyces helicus]
MEALPPLPGSDPTTTKPPSRADAAPRSIRKILIAEEPKPTSTHDDDIFPSTPTRGTALDREIREMAIRALAVEFMTVADAELDVRAFMVETTLPTLILAVEKLLCEVERRGILEMEEGGEEAKEGGGGDGEIVAAVAAEGSEAESAKPPAPTFDSINWLAQYLYRNNPRYSNFSDLSSSPYLQGVQSASSHLKSRLFELETTQRARKRAEEYKRLREEERARQARTAQLAERERTFRELWVTIFRKWGAKMWRPAPGFVLTREMGSPNMLTKVDNLIKGVNPTDADAPQTGDAEAPKTPTPFADRLGQDEFTRAMMQQTQSTWSIEDLNDFFAALSTAIDALAETNRRRFEEAFFLPKFADLSQSATKEEWLKRFGEVVEGYAGAEADAIGEACRAFCSGGPGSVGLMEAGSGGSRRPSTSGPGTPPAKGALEAEAEYRLFAKTLVGSFGIEPTKELMEYLEMRVDEDTARVLREQEALQPAAPEPVPATVDADDAAAKDAKPEATEPHDPGVDARLLRAFAMFDQLDAAQTGDLLVANFNSVIERAMTTEGLRPEIVSALEACKFPVMARTLQSKRIARAQFAVHILERCAKVSDADFDDLVVAFGRAVDQGPDAKTVRRVFTAADRVPIEESAIGSIAALGMKLKFNISAACDEALDLVASVLEEFHPGHSLRGRVSLVETGRVSTVAGGESPGVEESRFLRNVACTPDFRADLLGTTVPDGQGLEGETLQTRAPLRVADIRTHPTALEADPFRITTEAMNRYVGMPMSTTDGCGVGVFSIGMVGAEDDFEDADVKFIEDVQSAHPTPPLTYSQTTQEKVAVATLMKSISQIDTREKATILAHAAKLWASKQANVDVVVYLPEPDTTWEIMYRLEEVVKPAGGAGDSPSTSAPESPYMRPQSATLVRMSNDSEETTLLWTCVRDLHMMENELEDGRTQAYFPVTDELGHCTAIIAVTPRKPALKILKEDQDEIVKTAKVFASAMDHLRADSFGSEGVKRILGDVASWEAFMTLLYAESIDENARRHLLFPKLMLLNVRDYLSKLDNKAISELRSYRKPPPTIHKIIKGVLYLFGKMPKEGENSVAFLKEAGEGGVGCDFMKHGAKAFNHIFITLSTQSKSGATQSGEAAHSESNEVPTFPTPLSDFQSHTLQFINMDLLKQMIDYDPTAVQKKMRFKRVKRVLKSIPHGDVKKRGSTPAEYMSDWLVISVDLRDAALAERKIRATTPVEGAGEEGEDEAEVEGDEEDEEEDDVSSLNTFDSEGAGVVAGPTADVVKEGDAGDAVGEDAGPSNDAGPSDDADAAGDTISADADGTGTGTGGTGDARTGSESADVGGNENAEGKPEKSDAVTNAATEEFSGTEDGTAPVPDEGATAEAPPTRPTSAKKVQFAENPVQEESEEDEDEESEESPGVAE